MGFMTNIEVFQSRYCCRQFLKSLDDNRFDPSRVSNSGSLRPLLTLFRAQSENSSHQPMTRVPCVSTCVVEQVHCC